MNAKLSHFSELSNFLSEKSSICNDFLSLLDRFKLDSHFASWKWRRRKVHRHWISIRRDSSSLTIPWLRKAASAWKVSAESMTMSLRSVHLDTSFWQMVLRWGLYKESQEHQGWCHTRHHTAQERTLIHFDFALNKCRFFTVRLVHHLTLDT